MGMYCKIVCSDVVFPQISEREGTSCELCPRLMALLRYGL